jgi:hypothetical protein
MGVTTTYNALKPRRTAMLWLIWIAVMLLIPILAGVYVWYQLRLDPSQPAPLVDPPAAPALDS